MIVERDSVSAATASSASNKKVTPVEIGRETTAGSEGGNQ